MPLNLNLGVPDPDATGGGSLERPLARETLPSIATAVVVVAALYFGRDVFMPLAIALLLTFALAPVVSFLRKFGVPRVVAVIASMLAACTVLVIFSAVLVMQVGLLAENISVYQANILAKVASLKEAGAGAGIIDRISNVIENVGRELERPEPGVSGQAVEPTPLPVEIVSSQRPIELLRSLITPLISPLATTGLIIVVVIFMLLEREDLRDRFIRLAGYSDLHRTTEALQDAGKRVGRYLLMQLVINIIYAVPITIGLWLLGIPNALLWGILALVLRFVPYIGPAIAMLLPIFLAVAVAPGWTLVLWTAGLFLAMELLSNNVMEPWLYGSRTGLSPLAIIVSAIFWAWLWGPVGLVLSTPLTVCLVVLGKHVPQFAFLEVLFGNEPVLEPHARLYQRLLAGDPEEATDHAEQFLEERYLADFYGSVAIPALLIGEQDRMRGVLGDGQRRQVAASARTLVANLEGIAQDEGDEDVTVLPETKEEDEGGDGPSADEGFELPDGNGRRVLCAGGRGELDDASAAMLAQVLEVQGAEVVSRSFADLGPAGIRSLDLNQDAVVIGFLNWNSRQHARFLVRRIKRANSHVRVGIIFWAKADRSSADDTPEVLARDIGADFVVFDMRQAVVESLRVVAPLPVTKSKPLLVGNRKGRKPAASSKRG